MVIWSLLTDIVFLLSGSLLLGGAVSRFGQSPIVGYLLAGMLLGGPGSMHLVKSEHQIEAIAELGVSLLLFSIGLEFSLERLKKLGSNSLIGGSLQVGFTLAISALVASACGFNTREAIAIGAMVSLSSTAIVLRTLMENGDIESRYGNNCLATLLIQDMAVVPLAILIVLLSGGNNWGDIGLNLSRIISQACLLIVGLYILLNHLAVKALRTLTLERNRELTIILAVVTGLGSALLARHVGISPALGAFVAGIILGGSVFATQIRADISSLRVILLTLFFGSAGMLADPIWIFQNLGQVLLVTCALLLIKLLIVWGIFLALKQPSSIAATTGIYLSQVGEFAFVLSNVAHSSAVITSETQTLIVSTTIVALFVSPFLLANASKLGTLLASLTPGIKPHDPYSQNKDDLGKQADVIIIGFGPAGQIAANAFFETDYRPAVIDLNRAGVIRAKELGLDAYVGDASQLEVLEHAHLSNAKVVLITIPHHKTAVSIVNTVRQVAPLAHVVVRSRYQQDTNDLALAGAHAIFGDEEEIGHSLGDHIRQWIAENKETAV